MSKDRHLDKYFALGECASLTKQIQKLEGERDNAANIAAALGANSVELGYVLGCSSATARKQYPQSNSNNHKKARTQ